MDTLEATNILLSKIKALDPENASKIMGYILIQDLSERDLLRLAFGPETLLQSLLFKAKSHLGLAPNTSSSTPSSPSPLNPIARPNNNNSINNINNNNPFSQSSPRVQGGGPFVDFTKSPSPHSWPTSGFSSSNHSVSPKSSPFLSYDNIRSGSGLVPPFLKNGGGGGGADCGNDGGDFLDEYQLDEYFSFLDDSYPKVEDFMQVGGFPVANGGSHLHRRRFSESDAGFGSEDGGCGNGFRPCLYFARGFCKNGDDCKYVHGGFGGAGAGDNHLVEANGGGGGGGVMVGSPRDLEGLFLQHHEEILRMKAAQQQQQQQQQQQRLAYTKYMNFLAQQQNDHQRMGVVAGMTGDEFHKFGQFHPERNDFLAFGMAEKTNSASRQIYLTFPAESTFKDEDVSNYFSTFGLVQDVRIPYQQKRMFGFVTFVHPETVKLILARGNPHFICDSRVLVKPYKEKGKVVTKRQLQLSERGSFSPNSSPSIFDPRELYDLHLGARMLYNTQEMMLRRKLEEEAEMQKAIELQGKRLINLQLPDLRGDYVRHHERSLSVGSPISLPSDTSLNQNIIPASDGKNLEGFEENGDNLAASTSSIIAAEQDFQHEANAAYSRNIGIRSGKEDTFSPEGCDVHKSGHGCKTVHALLDTLFASPTKSVDNPQHSFSQSSTEFKEVTEVSVTSYSKNNEPASVDIASDGAPH